MVKKVKKTETGWDDYNPKTDNILVIGDLHYTSTRTSAIHEAEQSILSICKGKTFSKIILLGDLFDKKPTTEERILLATLLKTLRNYSAQLHFILGNGIHTFDTGSGAIYEGDWMLLCSDFFQHTQLELGDFIFAHAEFKGTKYINGFDSKSTLEINPDKTYLSGHIHEPALSFNNINYVGSIYKTDFSEIYDKKRIAIIENGKIIWFPINSRPMHQIKLVGKGGGVKVDKETKEFLQNTPEKSEMDLKIVVDTDSQSLGAIDGS